MPFARIRDASYYLRVRLAAWYGAVFAGLVLVALLIVYEGSRHTIIRETDERLLEDAKETSQAVAQLHPDRRRVEEMLARKADTHTHERLFLQLIDPDGDLSWSSKEAPPGIDEDLRDFTDEVAVREVGVFRVAQRYVDAAGAPRFLVRVGASQEQIDAAVWKRTRVMMVAGLLIIILAPLGGYWVAGSAIQPLTSIIHTAQRLRPTQLSDRLPIRGTGDELDQLSGTINRFLDRIGEYLARNREFVANAAHELRSPLAAIRSSVEVALNASRTTAEYQALLETVADECSQLTSLVNQLLLLAESDAGRVLRHVEPLQLDRLVDSSAEMFRGVAEERGVVLEADLHDKVRILGDAARLRQVINNLIDNAVKFTPAGGRVRIETECREGDRKGVLRVSDTGCGIPAHDLAHVFERFYRGDKSREREGPSRGTGLGLAITRAIIHAHAGEIEVVSSVGRGTTFLITLPLADAAPQLDTADKPIDRSAVGGSQVGR
ncbi:MAG: HAMP domain-containing protein [Planctomycetaceae bacterium]|nr:HAMP domain-containing protein [Planctomycetaceae bacterium]